MTWTRESPGRAVVGPGVPEPVLAEAAAGALKAALGHAAGLVWVHGLAIGASAMAWLDRRDAAVPTAARIPVPAGRLRIAVGLATVGRPEVCGETLTRLCVQTRLPDRVLVSVPSPSDLAAPAPEGLPTTVLVGPRGLTRQRNAILTALDDVDLVCFFDDDFVPDPGYLAALERAFLADPGLIGATGRVLADGITGPGYSFAEADRVLGGASPGSGPPVPVYSLYGCNMAFRVAPLRAAGLSFDEVLPAYGWLEDVDFSRRAARLGRLARVGEASGVHLGVKGGRQSGRRFGYSQVANPLYLVGKGSYALPRAGWLMGRNLAMNLLRGLRPEPHVDRRGRLVGNLRALADLARGRLHPGRIADLA
ncbi:glycosyltransferase family 2 protein [Methylobacterium sp. JK268]